MFKILWRKFSECSTLERNRTLCGPLEFYSCAPGMAHDLWGESPLYTYQEEVLAEDKGVVARRGPWPCAGMPALKQSLAPADFRKMNLYGCWKTWQQREITST